MMRVVSPEKSGGGDTFLTVLFIYLLTFVSYCFVIAIRILTFLLSAFILLSSCAVDHLGFRVLAVGC